MSLLFTFKEAKLSVAFGDIRNMGKLKSKKISGHRIGCFSM